MVSKITDLQWSAAKQRGMSVVKSPDLYTDTIISLTSGKANQSIRPPTHTVLEHIRNRELSCEPTNWVPILILGFRSLY